MSGLGCFLWILQVVVILVLNRLDLSRQEPEWKTRQASHPIKNYTNAELEKFCALTDIRKINKYLDHIAILRPVDSENHKKVALYIRFFLEELGYRAEFGTFTQSTVDGRKNFTNIIATKFPAAHRRLVLACHYDSKTFTEFNFIGATDSALPCALMLDVADTLNSYMKEKPNNDLSLQLMFFDGEEAFQVWDENDSLYGSKQLADLLSRQAYPLTSFYKTTELDRLDALVLLDLLGTANPQICNYPMVNEGKIYSVLPEVESQLLEIGNCLAPINKIFGACDRFLRIQDDHTPFQYYGVKIVHLIPWQFPKVWHTKNDDRDALDAQTIENLSVILRVFVARYLGL